MTISSTSSEFQRASRAESAPIGGLTFERLMAGLSVMLIGGLYLDGWAHNHGKVDNTFFTPWHAVLYSAFFLNGVVLAAVLLINHRRGRSWLTALPEGYLLSFLGSPLFIIGGIGDLIWHTLFGFEVGIAPLLSPTHLLLALSGFLIMSGPLRSAWRRAERRQQASWPVVLAPLLSLMAVLSLFTFFTSYASLMEVSYTVTAFPYTGSNGSWGSTGVILQAVLLIGSVLFVVRRWRLPLGSFTLLFTLNAALMSVFKDKYVLILPAFLAGVIADIVYARLQPLPKNRAALRVFAFIVPFVYTLALFLTIIFVWGTSWTIHLWLGVSVIAGIVGLLMSYLLWPPAMPVRVEGEE